MKVDNGHCQSWRVKNRFSNHRSNDQSIYSSSGSWEDYFFEHRSRRSNCRRRNRGARLYHHPRCKRARITRRQPRVYRHPCARGSSEEGRPDLSRRMMGRIRRPRLVHSIVRQRLPGILRRSIRISRTIFINLCRPRVTSKRINGRRTRYSQCRRRQFVLFFSARVGRCRHGNVRSRGLQFDGSITRHDRLV